MIIEFLIVFAVGCWIGSTVRGVWMAMSFREILRDLGVTDQQLRTLAEKNDIQLPEINPDKEESLLPILEVRVEKTDLGLFAYRKDNSLFLARGADRQELMDNLVNNLTNVRVIVHKEDGADLINP